MATNGGIIGKSNKASFGKCVVTSKKESGNITLQTGTRLVSSTVIAGGGGGGHHAAGGGGGGGLRTILLSPTPGEAITAVCP